MEFELTKQNIQNKKTITGSFIIPDSDRGVDFNKCANEIADFWDRMILEMLLNGGKK